MLPVSSVPFIHHATEQLQESSRKLSHRDPTSGVERDGECRGDVRLLSPALGPLPSDVFQLPMTWIEDCCASALLTD